jgi:hypothetical protein
MPYYRKRARKSNLDEWTSALPSILDRVRDRLGLAADEVVADAVLLAEVEHHFRDLDLWPPEAWFKLRLAREADSEADREIALTRVLAEARQRDERGARRLTYALLDRGRSMDRSRRGAPPRTPPTS